MLDSYHEEVRKKRNAYAIFWGVVFVFAVLLFMFFQGYYFSVNVGFEKLLKQGTGTTAGVTDTPILRSFGIINLRVEPNPRTLTLNGAPYANGEKRFVDYGEFEMLVEEPGYIPLTLDIELSRNHSFYLNNIRLFRNPAESAYAKNLDRIEKLENGYLAFDHSGSIWHFTSSASTGALIQIKPTGTGSLSGSTNGGTGAISTTQAGRIASVAKSSNLPTVSPANLSGSISSLGEGYFAKNNKVYSLDSEGTLVPEDTYKTISLCPGSKMIRGDIYCPGSRKFLTGKYRDIREAILEVNTDFIRTENSLIRLGGTLFNSSTPITGNVTLSGSSRLISYHDKPVLLNQKKLYSIEDGFREVVIEGFDGIYTTEKFGDEVLTVGTFQGISTIRLEDGKNNALEAKIPGFEGKDVSIALLGGAYVISSEKEVVLYYKGARSAYTLAKGEILGMIGKTILYNKDGTTYYLSLEEETP